MKAVSPTVVQQQESLAPYGRTRKTNASKEQRQTHRQGVPVHGVDLVSWHRFSLLYVACDLAAARALKLEI